VSIERRRLFYEGRVQGVGFRMTAARLARAHPVAGHVRNLDDGRVELLVEGDRPAVLAFLEAIRRELGEGIRDVVAVPEPTDPVPLAGFSIRH